MVSSNLEILIQLATFRYGWNSTVVVLATTLLGLAGGLIGTFVVLQKRSLVADAVSHCALPGVCLAFILGKYFLGIEKGLFILILGAGLSGMLGLIYQYSIINFSRLKDDVATAMTLSVFFGAGILLLSLIQTMGLGGEGGLHHFIFGQTASMKLSDAYAIAGIAMFVLISVLMFQKELFLCAFDREFSSLRGFSPGLLDAISLFLLLLVVLVGIQAVGMLLVVSFIVMPSVSARFWTNDSNRVLILSAFIGAISGYLGSVISGVFSNVPAGPLIVIVSGVVFTCSFLLAPNRGLLHSLYQLTVLRLRVEEVHILRDFLSQRAREKSGDQENVSVYFLRLSWIKRVSMAFVLIFRGLLFVRRGKLELTKKGLKRAIKINSSLKLWRQYVDEYSSELRENVDYSSDLIEHVLSGKALDALSQELKKSSKSLADE